MEKQKEVEWVGRISDEFCGGKRALSKDIACKCFHSFNLKLNLKIFFTKIDSSKCDPKDSFLSIAPFPVPTLCQYLLWFKRTNPPVDSSVD